MSEAQASLDRFCVTTANARPRGATTVGALAEAEPLLPLPPVPYPATVSQTGPVDANASVAFRGARYSVPPGFIGTTFTVRHRLGSPTLEIVSPTGALVVVHRRTTGGLVRTPDHRAALEAALEAAVLGAFSTAAPCVPKGHHPPGPAARAAAPALRGPEAREVRIDLARYAELVEAAR